MEQSSCLPNVFGSLTQIEWWSGDAEKEKTDPLQHSLAPVPTRGQEKDPLDGTLNPNTLMQLDRFCKQVSKWAEIRSGDAEKEKTDPLQHSLAPVPTRGQEKDPLDGTLNPNTLMQLDRFCKQVSKWAEIRSGDAEKEKTDPLQHSLAPVPTRGQEKDPLDGTLNPNTLMQLDRFCKQVSKWAEIRSGDAEKEKTDPLQHSLAPVPTRGQEKDPLDGTLNPNTLMQLDRFCKQLDRFCKQVSKWAEIRYVQALLTECIAPHYAFLILFSHASLSRLPHRVKFLRSPHICGSDSDVVVDMQRPVDELFLDCAPAFLRPLGVPDNDGTN
ncbi:Natural cytotoxicity triggering receptor 3 ligand 1 [Manis javanica]|nr:Natural cytotoxicity triggering receptor 3 ligand 1 [Manis javanica]